MKKEEIKLLDKLLWKFLDEYGEELQFSSGYIEPEQINLSELVEKIAEEMKKKKKLNHALLV